MNKILLSSFIAVMAVAMSLAPMLSASVLAQQQVKPDPDFVCDTKVTVRLTNVHNGTWYYVQLAEMYMSKQAGDQKSMSLNFDFSKGNPVWGIPTEPGPAAESDTFPPGGPMTLPVSCPAPGSVLVGYAQGIPFAVTTKDPEQKTTVSIKMPTVEEPPVEPPVEPCPPLGNGTSPDCPPIPEPCEDGSMPINGTCPIPGPGPGPGNGTEPGGNGTVPGNGTEPLPGNGTGNTTEPGNGTEPTPNGTDGNFISNLFS